MILYLPVSIIADQYHHRLPYTHFVAIEHKNIVAGGTRGALVACMTHGTMTVSQPKTGEAFPSQLLSPPPLSPHYTFASSLVLAFRVSQ
jgi:hypothetical protein